MSTTRIDIGTLQSQVSNLNNSATILESALNKNREALDILKGEYAMGAMLGNVIMMITGTIPSMINSQCRDFTKALNDFSNTDAELKNTINDYFNEESIRAVQRGISVGNYQQSMQNAVTEGKAREGQRGGAAYGKPNSNWCDAFARWVLTQAGISNVPINLGAQESMFSNYMHNNDGYQPHTGDLVFFDQGHNGSYDHVGVIVVDEVSGELYVLHGNYHVSTVSGGAVSYDKLSQVCSWDNASYKIADVESYVADNS